MLKVSEKGQGMSRHVLTYATFLHLLLLPSSSISAQIVCASFRLNFPSRCDTYIHSQKHTQSRHRVTATLRYRCDTAMVSDTDSRHVDWRTEPTHVSRYVYQKPRRPNKLGTKSCWNCFHSKVEATNLLTLEYSCWGILDCQINGESQIVGGVSDQVSNKAA